MTTTCTRCGQPAESHPMIARRTMTARGESVCPRCHSMIRPGHRIGLVDGIGWLHIECVLGRSKPAA